MEFGLAMEVILSLWERLASMSKFRSVSYREGHIYRDHFFVCVTGISFNLHFQQGVYPCSAHYLCF